VVEKLGLYNIKGRTETAVIAEHGAEEKMHVRWIK
jgi:hypothetical protein